MDLVGDIAFNVGIFSSGIVVGLIARPAIGRRLKKLLRRRQK